MCGLFFPAPNIHFEKNKKHFKIRITQSFLEILKSSKVILTPYTLTFEMIIEPFL